MENSQLDDIGRLLLQLDLDHTKYRVFRSEPPAFLRIAEEQDSDEEPPATQSLSAGDFVEPGDHRQGPPRYIEAAPETLVDRPLRSQEQEWTALESLLNLRAHTPVRSSSEAGGTQELPGTTIFGACGGVGTTTIISAMGRISARAGHPVLLIDSATPSFLPLSFGAQSPRSYTSTFTTSGHLRQRPVHIACGNPDELVPAFSAEIDRFYFDGGLFRATSQDLPEHPTRSSVLVLVPDARCLAELNRLARQPMKLPYLLLNQFDHRQPLHREIQSLLARQFGDRLIPVAISHDPDVSVALAQGTTIIDFAPASPATEDFYKLNEWLVLKSRNVPSFELTAAGQSL